MPLLVTALALFVPPLVYLAPPKKYWARDVAGALLLGPVLGFMQETFGAINHIWAYAPERMLVRASVGALPVDIAVWSFAWALFLIFIYERAAGLGSVRISRAYPIAALAAFIGCAWIVFAPRYVALPDAYLWWGIFSLWPIAAVARVQPKRLHDVCAAAAAAVPLGAVFEWTSCVAGYWTFPGQYIGTVVAGGCRLPVEEIVFWVIAAPFAVLALFVLFVQKTETMV